MTPESNTWLNLQKSGCAVIWSFRTRSGRFVLDLVVSYLDRDVSYRGKNVYIVRSFVPSFQLIDL